jgi:Transposase and inactivated derivatives
MKHRKTRRAINEPGHAHFLTCSCSRKLPLLSKDRSRQWVIDSLEEVRQRFDVLLNAYVIMPDHIHLLITPRQPEYKMSTLLAAIKRPVSQAAKEYLIEANQLQWIERLTARHGDRLVFRFWLPGGGFDENIFKTKTIEQIIDYIHANPVRRGLCERPTDWYWSSAKAYAGLEPIAIRVDPVEM